MLSLRLLAEPHFLLKSRVSLSAPSEFLRDDPPANFSPYSRTKFSSKKAKLMLPKLDWSSSSSITNNDCSGSSKSATFFNESTNFSVL